MGLRFASDLDAWQRWQDRRHLVRATARTVLGRDRDAPPAAWLAVRGEAPALVASVLESRAASSRLAVLAPLDHLADVPSAVLASFDPTAVLDATWTTQPVAVLDMPRLLPALRVVLSAAHYLPLGAAAFADAGRRGHTYATVQHGLLTPFAPPLPASSPVLAFSDADAQFWLSGRTDAEASAVGSQLLWAAAHHAAEPVSRFGRPTFLGQLHAAELPRAGLTLAATRFCRTTGATYRPHPCETDRASRAQHAAWRRLGITIDDSPRPLADLATPVVASFSTGICEAAARGVPSWAYYPRPPAWLGEFWERYGLAPWGGAPTPPPPQALIEPAAAVAAWVRGRL